MTQQPPTYKTVFVFLDTDKYCSPFDILVAIDAFPDSMIFKYENVTAKTPQKSFSTSSSHVDQQAQNTPKSSSTAATLKK